MAGNITEKDILENLPTCPTHHIQCIIKTGTKSNSTYGKSFYICNYTKERCSYALPARNISATTCPQHKEMVELKAFADKVEGLKCYYRCLKGRESGVGWCGNSILKKQQQNPLNNITNTYTNQKTNKSSQSDDYMTSTPFKNDKNHSKLDDKLDSPLFHIHKTTYNINTQKPMEKTSEKSVDENTVNNCVTGQRNIVTNPHIYRIPNSAAINKTSASTSMKVTKTISKDNDSSDNSTKSLSDTIEIVSSDDEENQEEDQKSNKHNISPPMISQGSLNEIMEKIKKQKEIYASIGRFAPDGGRKLLDNIDNLVKQYNQMKLQQQDTTAVQQSKQSTINFPKMLSDYPPSLFANIAEQRAAPLFGGRMTESRLKEVGRITKGAIEHLHKSLEACPGPSEESDEPKGLHVSLMTHQKQALLWLLWRERQIPSGGILADDMGLGKTLTMISLVLKSKQADFASNKELPANSKLHSSKATLVICPASLVHQWHKEIEKRVQKSYITVCLYHGTNRDKQVRRLANYDMVLTTYNIVSIEGKPHVESEKDSKGGGHSEWLDASQPKSKALGPLFKISWRRLILDEGHTVKNHKTAMSISACALESESRWIVTGTPIQNQTMDLYSLIKFLRLSPFDELKVWKREVDNKSNSGTKRMNSIVSSLLLRRTKNQTDQKTGKPLVSLPSRSCILHKLKLSEDEKSVYDLVQNYSKNMFTEYMHRNKDSYSTKDNKVNNADKIPLEVLGMNIDEALSMFGLLSVNSQNMGCLLVLILRLRQCCGHLSLMCEPIDTDICKAEGIEIPLEEQFGNLSIDQPSIANRKRAKQLHPSYSSTKTSSIISILKEFEKSRDSNGKPIKSVIVSQWTRMLDIIAFHLKNNGFRIEFITGSVPAKKRSEIVEAFNNEKYPQIMLVSLKAGGVGLNLIGGSHLFLIDQHWNPALEDQACDRIYRVGQLNDVVIHRFLCEETVEERIVQLQEKKKMLANSVLYGGKSQKLTLNDLQVLFGVSST